MANVENGDLIKIEITGKLSDGSVFETTNEQLARDTGVWSNTSKYGSRLVIVGRGAMIAGLETEIPKMKIGESKKIHVDIDKAFGKKHSELVRVMPMKEFEKHGVHAMPGLMITIDGVPAMVKSVSSGRVMLDFNHPLAGQALDYEIKLLEIISDPIKKAEALADQFGGKVNVKGQEYVISGGIENSKAKGLEAALRACLGEKARVLIE